MVPGDAPLNKQARARSYGAEVVLSEVRHKGDTREIHGRCTGEMQGRYKGVAGGSWCEP